MNIKVNRRFKHILNSKKKNIVLAGGAASGKSIFAIQKIMHNIEAGISSDVLMLRRYRVDAITCFPNTFAIVSNQFKLSRVGGYIYWKNNKINMGGIEDIKKCWIFKKWDLIFIENADELLNEDFELVVDKIKSNGQIIYAFNPALAVNSFLFKKFYDVFLGLLWEDNESIVSKTTYKDNKYLSRETVSYIDSLSATDEYITGVKMNDNIKKIMDRWWDKNKDKVWKSWCNRFEQFLKNKLSKKDKD